MTRRFRTLRAPGLGAIALWLVTLVTGPSGLLHLAFEAGPWDVPASHDAADHRFDPERPPAQGDVDHCLTCHGFRLIGAGDRPLAVGPGRSSSVDSDVLSVAGHSPSALQSSRAPPVTIG